MTIDPDKYTESLFGAGAKQDAPVLVAAAVDAVLKDTGLKWCLPQMWNDKDNQYATHWRVLGLTKKRLFLVSAWSAKTLWTRDDDDLDQPDHGTLTEAWTRPLADVEALICDTPNLVAIGREGSVVETAPAYSIKLRSDDVPVPISARPSPRPEDHEAAARFADVLLSRWP